MKTSKRLLALLLVLAMAMSTLAACGKTEEKKEETTTKTETTTPSTDAGEETKEEGPFFPLKETETFTVWTVDNQNMAPGYENTETAVLMEELTNVKLDVSWVMANEAQEKFGLMIASGDIPDMVNSGVTSYYTGGSVQGVADGLFLETTDLVAQYMPNYAAILADHPDLKKDVTADDGKMYSIWGFLVDTSTREVMPGTHIMGVTVRRDFLEKAGLEMPTTMDEWTKALTAFKEMGIENPIRFNPEGVMSMGHFITAYGILQEFYVDGTEVKFGAAQPEYKAYLELMHEWYEKGLMDQNFTSYGGMMDLGDMADGNSGAGEIWWQFGGAELAFMGFPVPEELYWENIPYPVLNEGDTAYSGYKTSSLDTELCISSEVTGEKLETLCKYLDFMYTDPAYYAREYGREGVHYYFDDNNELQFTDMMHHDEVDNVVQMNINTSNSVVTTGLKAGDKADAFYPDGNASVDMQPVWTSADTSLVYPGRATMTEDEMIAYNTIYTNITTLVDEMTVKYIMGSEDLSTFDSFVENLYTYGLQECIDYKQAALDRYNAR